MLILAWALGNVVKDVQTAEYLSGALETGIQAYILPALISVSSARTSNPSSAGGHFRGSYDGAGRVPGETRHAKKHC